MNLESLLPFVKEADRLKTVERQSLIHSGGRRENTAEHSWHLAMTVLTFQHCAPSGMDLFKAVKMALLHDLVEIDAGDTFVYDDLSGKAAKEIQAIGRLTALLPNPLGQDFKALWLEFEAGECAESQFVSAIDRFLPIYSNYLNHGHSWKVHKISIGQVFNRCEKAISKIPGLWELTRKMLNECVERGELGR